MTQATSDVAGARMSYWIATALRLRRTQADISESDVATALGVNWRTIRRLESGRSMGRDIDKFVAGYAYLLGLEDPRVIWDDALKMWRHKGSAAPMPTMEHGPPAAFAEAIRAETQRQLAQGESARRSRRRATR